MKALKRYSLISLVLAGSYITPAMCATSNVPVSANVVGTCQFSTAGGVVFGALTPGGGAVTGTVTQPQFWCTKGTTYTLTDNKGLNEGGTGYAASFTAVIQCAGNGRSFFDPRIPGGQWKNGAMANVTWGGARLKDVLGAAGVKVGSVDVSFNGLDYGPLPTVPDFVKSLTMDHALEEDTLIAYEMNGKPLTMLNGFPARLIVPGWYATYWVKALSDISVNAKAFEGFWMNPAYRIPDTDCGCIPPGSKPARTIPIHRMSTRSLIITPGEGATRSRASPEGARRRRGDARARGDSYGPRDSDARPSCPIQPR